MLIKETCNSNNKTSKKKRKKKWNNKCLSNRKNIENEIDNDSEISEVCQCW